ncbi:MAG TPA: CRISPR-associated protein Cas5 [Chitinophagaceae bacterium]
MEILQFDLNGKFAHFRKYYANNTAMSYSIPPRTTIMGILAAILGKPRDSYYQELSSGNIRIGIALKVPVKKNFHRLNLLSIKGLGDMSKSFESDFRKMSGNSIQTPFEVVTGLQLQKDEVRYRIFISCFEDGINTFNQLKRSLSDQSQVYPVTLGVANFNAFITNYKWFAEENIIERQAKDELVSFNSAVDSEKVTELQFDKEEYKMSFVEEELLTSDFKADGDREVSKMNRVLFTSGDILLKVRYTGKFYILQETHSFQTIQFLD